jgi:NADPH:quinone reductase-like Zn-dependent oxidoreductase
MTETMRAVVLDAPGPPTALRIRELPVPQPRPGWVLIRVKAFGINRSELHTRLGLAQGVIFPRVLGIEATGIVAAAPGAERPLIARAAPPGRRAPGALHSPERERIAGRFCRPGADGTSAHIVARRHGCAVGARRGAATGERPRRLRRSPPGP